MQPLPDFLRLQEAECLVESWRLEIQEQRNSDRLQVANAFRCFDRRAGQNSCAPRLFAKFLRELRCKLFQFIDVIRLANERESQVANLGEITIVNFQSFDRFEPAGRRFSTSLSSFIRVTRT